MRPDLKLYTILLMFLVSCTEMPVRKDDIQLKRNDLAPLGYIEFNLKNEITIQPPGGINTTTINYDGIPYPVNKEILAREYFPTSVESIKEYFDVVQSVVLKVHLINYIPMQMTTGIYMIEGKNQVTDSLFQKGQIQISGAEIFLSGKVLIPSDTIIEVLLERDQIDRLLESEKMEVFTKFTINENLIKNGISLNDSSRVWLQISANVETTTKLAKE